jgi:uncharacterized protein YndB with AHSA1/START domain
VVENASSQPAMTIVRVFDAPRALMWKAWTDPQHLKAWFGPTDFTNPFCEVDVRTGGTFRLTMQSPDGVLYPINAVYDEVVEPERLVWTSDVEHGDNVDFEIRNVVTFTERDGKTEITLQAFVLRATPESADALGGMHEGWSQSLDKLDELLARRS